MTTPCTIVIPCYNEAARFPIDAFLAFADAHASIRFLLVNDGSKDDTLSMLNRLGEGRQERVGVLNQTVNQGKGEAVRQGMLAAMEQPGCLYAGFWDADMATPLPAIEDFLEVLRQRPEIMMVFGARVKLLGRQIERRAIRHYLGRVFATVVSNLLRLPIYDTQCGAKMFRVSPQAKELFGERFSSRWVFDVEIIARFIHQHRDQTANVASAIYEFPLMEWRDVAGSKVKPRDFFRAFFDVLRIRRQYKL